MEKEIIKKASSTINYTDRLMQRMLDGEKNVPEIIACIKRLNRLDKKLNTLI